MPEVLPTPRYCIRCGHNLVERMIASEHRMRLVCEGCGFVHYINPRVVTGIIVEHGGRVLLQQRAVEPRIGFWTYPGGFLEADESVQAGALRETKEEVGLDVTLGELVGIYTRTQVGIVVIVYAGTSASDAAYVADPESQAVAWYAPEAIPWDLLAFDTTRDALGDYLRQRGLGAHVPVS